MVKKIWAAVTEFSQKTENFHPCNWEMVYLLKYPFPVFWKKEFKGHYRGQEQFLFMSSTCTLIILIAGIVKR